MQDSDLTITEICEKLQFTNRTYFYKAFEQVFGVTPNKFRLQQQKDLVFLVIIYHRNSISLS